MGLCNKCLAKSEVISKPCITMMLVVGLKNAVLIGKQHASSVWQGIHEDPGISGESFKLIGHVVHPTTSGLAACRYRTDQH